MNTWSMMRMPLRVNTENKSRLSIQNTTAAVHAVEILEEFGFDQKAALDAILANRSIATFSTDGIRVPETAPYSLQRLKV